MDIWQQNYHVVGNSYTLTALVSLVPIVFFLLALTLLKMKGHLASLITLLISAVIAYFLFNMPAASVGSAALYGVLFGLWPIGWIVLWAIFIYNVSVESGQFHVIKNFISGVSQDQRIQVLLIAFAFGIFLEGVAGFGIPIAIGAGLLLGCGMRSPVLAAAVCLVSNMASAPTGAIGIPVIVAASVTHVPINELAALISRQLCVVILLIPAWLVLMVDGIRGLKDTFPMVLVLSVVSCLAVYISYNFIGSELSDVILGIVGMVVIIAFSKVWKPKHLLTANGYLSYQEALEAGPVEDHVHYSAGRTLLAWSPYIVLTVLALLWTQPAIKNALNHFTISFHMPYLDHFVAKGAEVANPAPGAQYDTVSAVWNFDIIKAVGTAILFTSIYTVIVFKVSLKRTLRILAGSIKQLVFPILTICFVLGFAKIADYSGQTTSIALLLAKTGSLFPLFAPLLGTLGVFLTGSVTNSNTLFAKVQLVTGETIHVNPHLLVASNTLGSIAGKVISPQSIAIGCAATNNQGHEGNLLAAVFKHAIIFAVFVCIMTYLQAGILSWTAVV